MAGEAWAGRLMQAPVGYQDLLARRALGKLEGGGGLRGVCGSNRVADLEINWNLTLISILKALLQCGQMIHAWGLGLSGPLLVG